MRLTLFALFLFLFSFLFLWPSLGTAIGEATAFELRTLSLRGLKDDLRPTATRRMSWAVRTRTSVETILEPSSVTLSDRTLFEQPFLYLVGDRAFPMPSSDEIERLSRFLRFGGFLLIDDASDGEDGFDGSVRELLSRALPDAPLGVIPRDHVLYRSFYLVDRPVGRVQGPETLEGVELSGRLAVIYSRHDLGGAWARDNLGNYHFAVAPGGERQREIAYRLGVNIVIYSLTLDYKDDQVHAPFIMRRRGGGR